MRFVLPPDVFPREFVILCYWALILANAVHEGIVMKVFIADDSRVVVERLASLLEEVPGARLVGQAGDLPPPGIGIQKMKPDAVILALHMPCARGLDVLRAIRTDHPHLYFLALSTYTYT